ncbi:hypothetical protein C8F01DRAFT_1098786 [Mycena amicta]|nr:hypothetical protein C8F01DRAFT_1098786 [Mycena amicta]
MSRRRIRSLFACLTRAAGARDNPGACGQVSLRTAINLKTTLSPPILSITSPDHILAHSEPSLRRRLLFCARHFVDSITMDVIEFEEWPNSRRLRLGATRPPLALYKLRVHAQAVMQPRTDRRRSHDPACVLGPGLVTFPSGAGSGFYHLSCKQLRGAVACGTHRTGTRKLCQWYLSCSANITRPYYRTPDDAVNGDGLNASGPGK